MKHCEHETIKLFTMPYSDAMNFECSVCGKNDFDYGIAKDYILLKKATSKNNDDCNHTILIPDECIETGQCMDCGEFVSYMYEIKDAYILKKCTKEYMESAAKRIQELNLIRKKFNAFLCSNSILITFEKNEILRQDIWKHELINMEL